MIGVENLFDRLKEWIRGVQSKLIRKSELINKTKLPLALSDEMESAILTWSSAYEDHPYWKTGTVKTSNMPAIIASKLAKAVTLEAEFSLDGSARASYINDCFGVFRDNLRNSTEFACAKGGIMFKPYISDNQICIDYIQQGKFFPTAYDSNKKLTGVVFVAQKTSGQDIYTRLEHHELSGETYRINNTAYKSQDSATLGKPIPLSAVSEWAELSPQVTMTGVSSPLFAYFKMPMANTIDSNSPLGVSCFSRAMRTIKELDKQYSRYLWEFEGGTLIVHADSKMFRPNPATGKPTLPEGKERLYQMIESFDSNGNFYEVFAPAFRDTSLLSGFNTILRLIESQCGLAFGTLSDVQQVAKTATETVQAKQEYYSTVVDIQKSLEAAIRQLIYAVDVWCTIGNLCPPGNVDSASFSWDDSIVVDKDAKKLQFWQYVTAGKFPAWKFFVEFEGYTEKEARALCAEVTEEQPTMFPQEE